MASAKELSLQISNLEDTRDHIKGSANIAKYNDDLKYLRMLLENAKALES